MSKKERKPIREYSAVVSSYSLNDGCYYCGGIATQWDHVVPRKLGGKSNIENLVPVCCSCNSSKGSKSLIKFRHHLAKKGLPHDFDTPDPKPIVGMVYIYSINDRVFISLDGTLKLVGLDAYFNRVYVNDK